MKKARGTVLFVFLLLACSAKETPRQPLPAAEVPIPDDALWNNPTGTRIGLLLPLSGEFGRFGEATLDGIACATGLFEPCPLPGRPVQMIVRDTQGIPALAAIAAQELIEKEKVSALIGPLLSQEVAAVAQAAATHQIPFLILAPQKKEKIEDPYCFQHSLVPEKEVVQIVKRSLAQGLNSFILFYPENSYGQQYKELFGVFLEKEGGGKIIKQASYPPDLPDFTGTLQQLFEGLPTSQRLGLFIPDSHRRIVKMAEALGTLAISPVQLIGTSRWHHPKLLVNKQSALEGALMDTPFFGESTREAAQSFRANFLQTFGAEPSWLEAIGFDAMQLVLTAIQQKGTDYPPDVRDGLAAIENFAAVVGPLSWDKEGVSDWPLDFLTIQNGQFIPLP